MAIRELEVEVRRADGRRVLDLAGDIDAHAEDALQAAYEEAAGDGRAVVLTSRGTDYINSAGIALIVWLLAGARRARDPRSPRAALGPLPRDLRDHAPGGLHADRRRR